MKRWLFALIGLAMSLSARAEIQTALVEYRDGDAVLEGYVAYDDAITTPRPAVMVVHDWDGPNDYEQRRARMLAELGYVGFAADIYGKGVRPKSVQENAQQAGKYRSDRATFLSRMNAAVAFLRNHPRVDKAKVAAMGYCFGGGGVLELARSGADLSGVVSFHGGLKTSAPAKAGEIRTKILVCHASQDPSVPYADLVGFLGEMRDARADYQLVAYNVDSHPFTAPGPGYRPEADRRSWSELQTFLREIFGGA
ncbi:MAG: dienelactone hydrolase family protein [Fimbriimonadaceae bacterium]|nr:dienelactone hydrolase family protein [Fimbriimonadaceae bacterium]